MIVEAIFGFFFAILNGFLSLLPSWDPIDLSALWSAVDSGPGQTVFGFLAWGNYYLPLTEALAVATLSLTLWIGVYVVRFVIWVLQLLHIAGGSS